MWGQGDKFIFRGSSTRLESQGDEDSVILVYMGGQTVEQNRKHEKYPVNPENVIYDSMQYGLVMRQWTMYLINGIGTNDSSTGQKSGFLSCIIP